MSKQFSSQQEYSSSSQQLGNLNSAMQKMQKIIEAHILDGNNNQEDSQQDQDFQKNNNNMDLEQYVRLLDKKYNSVLEILEKEDQQLQALKKKNVELKSNLSMKIKETQDFQTKNHESLLKPIESLKESEKNQKHEISEQLEELKIKKISDISDRLSEDLAQKTEILVDTQSLNQQNQNKILQLRQKLEEQQDYYTKNSELWENQQQIFQQKMKELLSNKNTVVEKLQTIDNNSRLSQVNIQKIETFQQDTQNIQTKYIYQQNCLKNKQKKFNEVSEIFQRLQAQLQKTNSELEEIRVLNQNLNKIEQNQSQYEKEYVHFSIQNSKLVRENEALMKKKGKILEFQKFSQKIEDINQSMDNYNNEIHPLAQSTQHCTKNHQSNGMLNENGEGKEGETFQLNMQNVQSNVQQRERVLQRQFQEIKEKTDKTETIHFDMKQMEIQKNDVENAIKELENQMDYLAQCFNHLDERFNENQQQQQADAMQNY